MVSRAEALALSILIIEDDPMDMRLIQREIMRYIPGAECTFAQDASAAIEAVVSIVDHGMALPSVIVCDAGLPGMSGPELVKTLRASGYFKGVPIIGHSGSHDPRVKEAFIEAGGTDFISKSDRDTSGLATSVLEWAAI